MKVKLLDVNFKKILFVTVNRDCTLYIYTYNPEYYKNKKPDISYHMK
jgi:hypothetical protein